MNKKSTKKRSSLAKANANGMIPNSFQLPNVIIDKYMPLLTSEEMRVFIWACRHIFGWRDKIANRCRNISVSSFEKGFGEFPGCGLCRDAIMNALSGLSKYGLLEKIGTPTDEGQLWKIPDNENRINTQGLIERKEAKASKQHEQTKKARSKKPVKLSIEIQPVGLSDRPPIDPGLLDRPPVCWTDRPRSVVQTDPGLLDRHKQTQLLNPASNPEYIVDSLESTSPAPENGYACKTNQEKVEWVINSLNAQAGTKYRASTPATQKIILARIRENFNAADFLTVIKFKCKEWRSDPEMAQYLRPQTLFGTKFESYLQRARMKHPDSLRIPQQQYDEFHGSQHEFDEAVAA